MDNKDIPCKEHPDAPHGFMRDASHSAGRYVCECEFWEPPKNKPMTRDEWKEWLRESWDEAQARTHTIKTWRDRCEEHPDHEGIVTERMIRNRMQEEIDELRQAIAEEEKREWVGLTGMTLRDYFAAKAMQGLFSCGKAHDEHTAHVTAKASYLMADAMLKAREA